MAETPSALRQEAASLAIDLPGVLLEARRLASRAPGVHGRRRSGQGEDFWQFRDHRAEDGQRLVDWRRSARGDRLFVREREMQAAQTAQIWVDPTPGFAWSSAPREWPAKRRRALIACVALGILLARGGERVGALGGPATAGTRAPERLAEALMTQALPTPPAPMPKSKVVIATDGYAPVDLWRARLQPIADVGAHGVVVLIADPAEEDFPFTGRVLFQAPEGGRQEVMFGRAEDAKQAYAARLKAHRADLRAMTARMGLELIAHRTDRPAAPLLSALFLALSERGA